MREKINGLNQIVDGVVAETSAFGAKDLICLSPPTLQRMFRSFGYDCKQISEPYTCPEDRLKYAVLMMPAVKAFVETKKSGVANPISLHIGAIISVNTTICEWPRWERLGQSQTSSHWHVQFSCRPMF